MSIMALLWPSGWHPGITEVLLGIVICLIVCLYMRRTKHFGLWKRHGIPGPTPSLIFGNLLQLRTKDKDVLAVQTEWLQTYGKVCGYYIGYRPTLMIADLDILSSILIKDFPAFANRARHHLATKPYCDMLVDKRDHNWKMLRTLINPVFSLSKLKQMLPLMQDCVDDFLGVVSECVDAGRDFNIFSLSQGFTLDVIGRCALAMRIDCQKNQNDPLLQLIRKFFKFAISPLVVAAMIAPGLAPWLRRFRGTTTAALVEKKVISNLREVIEVRRQRHGDVIDFLQLLIDASDEGVEDALEMLDPSSRSHSQDAPPGSPSTSRPPPPPPPSPSPLPPSTSSISLSDYLIPPPVPLPPSSPPPLPLSSPPPPLSSPSAPDGHNCMVDRCCRQRGKTGVQAGVGDLTHVSGVLEEGEGKVGSRVEVVALEGSLEKEDTGEVEGDLPKEEKSLWEGHGSDPAEGDDPTTQRTDPILEKGVPAEGDDPTTQRTDPIVEKGDPTTGKGDPTDGDDPIPTKDDPTVELNDPRRSTPQPPNRNERGGSSFQGGGGGGGGGGPLRPRLTDDEVVANAYMFLLAGYETTANAIAFTSYTLARYPKWQELCVEEIQSVLGDERTLTYEHVSSLHTLERVFQETLRIYPPVPSFVTREAGQDRNIGGFKIPKGVNVTVPVWHIHHDPTLWPDPERFDPDRFLPERKRDRPSLSWMPFGAGPRNCIGIRFARLEAKLALANILRNYAIELAPYVKDPLPIGVQTVTLCPTEGVWLRARRRTAKD